jgi:hypothetical protein
MNILVTLNSGLGADTGPNFNLTANVGSVTPSTATKLELLAGKFVDVNASATQITVTSTGTCTTSIVLNISGQTTSTTTAGVTSFVLGRDGANFYTACTKYTTDPITYYGGVGATLQIGTTLYFDNTLTNKVVFGYYSNGTDWYLCNTAGLITSTGSCSTTTTTSTSTTSTTTAAPSTTTTTSTTSTTTTLPPETFSLGYSATTDWQACFASQTNYYSYTGDILQNGLNLFTDITLTTKAPSGWYSNGANYWYISPNCFEYTFTNNTGVDDYVDYFDCDGNSQQIYVYDGTTSTAVCAGDISNLRGMIANNNGVGTCQASTTGIFQDEAVCPTTTTTSTTSTSTSTTSTSTSTTSTTSTSSTTTTTEAPTTTSTSSTTSTTTVPLPPGETSTTTTSTTQPSTTSTSTSTTTTTTQPPTTSTSTSTSTSTTTLGTTAAPTVDISIQNVGSLDIPITGMTINGVAVTWVGAGPDFVLSAGDNGSFTSTQIGTYDVVISYGTHIPGQRITFIDSAGTPTCQTLSGSGGTFTITNATITAGTTITVEGLDGVCP